MNTGIPTPRASQVPGRDSFRGRLPGFSGSCLAHASTSRLSQTDVARSSASGAGKSSLRDQRKACRVEVPSISATSARPTSSSCRLAIYVNDFDIIGAHGSPGLSPVGSASDKGAYWRAPVARERL
jgi:hypothetical protein